MLGAVPARELNLFYTELGTEPNLETLTLFVGRRPPSLWVVYYYTKMVRVSGSKFEVFFWLGVGLGYIKNCDVTLVCAHVHPVVYTLTDSHFTCLETHAKYFACVRKHAEIV